MEIWIYWSESNPWIYFKIVLKKMKNLLFWTKFYWSWTGGPVLIVRTDLVINSKGSILDFKRYNIGSWLPQTNAYVPPIPFLCYRYWVPQTNTYVPPIPFLCYRYWLPQTNAYAPLSHSCATDTLPEPWVHFHHWHRVMALF
jgi:hypothetical protein